MIAVNIQGRLGNQLFEYAFAYSASKQLHTFVLFDNVKQFTVPTYFQVSRFPTFIDHIPGIRILYRKKVLALCSRNSIDWNECSVLHDGKQILDEAYYSGFFQSALYFNRYEADIRSKLRVRRQYRRLFEQLYAGLKNYKLCVLHVRMGDYQSFGAVLQLGNPDKTLPISYYEACFQQISNLEEYQVVCVSDDVVACKQMFHAFPFVHFLTEKTDLITDFQLLSHADIAVISNSTFSWWAAYLNRKKGKVVFAPKYFLGFDCGAEFPQGISTATGFRWIDVPAAL